PAPVAVAPQPIVAPKPAPVAQPALVAPAPVAAPAPQPAPVTPAPQAAAPQQVAAPASQPAAPAAKKSSKGLLIGLIAGGVALVAAIVVILCVFVFGGEDGGKGTSGSKKSLSKIFRSDIKYETITDSRDQQQYRTVTIGGKVWMAQNLNYAAEDSRCEECDFYGRTYGWTSAINSCPEGFVLPSMTDFENLMANMRGVESYQSIQGWEGVSSAGQDLAGLAMLPAGFYSYKDNVIKRRGEMAGFWARSGDGRYAMRLKVDAKNGVVSQDGLEMDYGFSVRCVSKATSADDAYTFVVDSRTNQPLPTVQIGNQVWLQKNMDYVNSKMTKNYCYDDMDDNCALTGRLYEWGDAVAACPEGTRLPNAKDFEQLASYLKSSGNYSAFEPTYAGFRNSKGVYELENIRADYWSSSDISGMGKYWYFSAGKSGLVGNKYSKKGAMLARCIKDTLSIPYEIGEMTDSRDGRTYGTVKIGSQTWMAENMKYQTGNSYCYNNEYENCEIYGRLYTWSDAYDACPAGYRMPDDDDWIKLKNYISDRGNGKLVSMLKSTDYWKTPGRDVVGMNIRPSGYYGVEDGKFGRLGERAYLWSASMKNWDSAYHWALVEGSEYFGKASAYKENARSVRCVKNY
ncbi:MAG: hypothetical protein MJY87_11610, partial [Fibrobacter sp.]|nr:hypothetical protein [Fibrobacter sp.]